MGRKALFVSFFSMPEDLVGNGSPAGTKVQLEIKSSLDKKYDSVSCYTLRELASWPKNRMFYKGVEDRFINFPFIVNLPIIKFIFFTFSVIRNILVFKPDVVYQYNSYFSINVLCLFLRMFRIKTVLILQDVNVEPRKVNSLKKMFEFISLKIARHSYDLFVPISQALIDDFKFEKSKSLVWRGGVIGDSFSCKYDDKNSFLDESNDIKDYAVIAGTLQPYNGVYQLVLTWIKQGIELDLHVFGGGSEEDKIRELANNCSNVFFHGKKEPSIVSNYLRSSSLNICLRYSIGINEKYFFPSKFFDIFPYPGAVVVNKFYGFPQEAQNLVFTIADDLSDLRNVIDLAIISERDGKNVFKRRMLASDSFSWDELVNITRKRLGY